MFIHFNGTNGQSRVNERTTSQVEEKIMIFRIYVEILKCSPIRVNIEWLY